MDDKTERKLRPKTPVLENEDDRFNFDIPETKIPSDRKLVIVSRRRASLINTDPRFTEKRNLISSMKLEITKHELPCISENDCHDLLSDDIYRSYHKKMQKQESRMINDDKIQSEAEAERLQNLSEKLDHLDWINTLSKLTVIHDMRDEEELLLKRDMTKQSIVRMLDKFRDMKRRSNLLSRNYRHGRINPVANRASLYCRIDRKLIMGYDSSSDEEEENMTPEQIRLHRKRNREANYGGTIIVQLKRLKNSAAKYAIVAEPLRASYIVKCSKEERELWSLQAAKLPDKFEYYPKFPKQIAVKRIPPKNTDIRGPESSILGTSVNENTMKNHKELVPIGTSRSLQHEHGPIISGLEARNMPLKKRKTVQTADLKTAIGA